MTLKFKINPQKVEGRHRGIYFDLNPDDKLKIDNLAHINNIARGEVVRQMIEHCLKDLSENGGT